MERIIRFYPAYDKRSSDPKKNYGIHGVEMGFFLKGPEGVIQFKVSTNWQLPHVREEEQDARNLARGLDRIGLRTCYHPMATDIGYHSYVPRYEGQEPITQKCEWLGGKPCYYDGSSLNARPIFDKLVAEGDEAVWQEMAEYYNRTFMKEAK